MSSCLEQQVLGKLGPMFQVTLCCQPLFFDHGSQEDLTDGERWLEDGVWAFLGSLSKCYLNFRITVNSQMCMRPSRESAQNEKRAVGVTLLNMSSSARWLSQKFHLKNF